MLKTPAPFPNVGSWALLAETGRTLAVRIVNRDGDDAIVSVAGEFVASATRRLPLAALLNADELSPAELEELHRIEARIAGKARPRKADVDRAHALGMRYERARVLRVLLEKQPEKHFPAAAAAARERAAGAAA